MSEERKNPFYLEGFRIGRRHGKIPSMQKMIKSKSFENAKEEDLKIAILNAYAEVKENIPVKLLEEELTCRDWQMWILGYTNGHIKHVRNRADKNYHEKVGLKSKSYKLHEDVIDAFSAACDKKGVSYASTLEKLMMGFVDETNEEEELVKNHLQ